MVRSYYLGLHEIAHCVLGYDHDQLAAPQEAATWRWTVAQAIEPPTPGLKRMMFKALWHYLLKDLGVWDAEQLSNRDLFPVPSDPFWTFLATLDDASRLLYQAAKITARTGPSAEWRARAYQELNEERRRSEQALEQAKHDARRAVMREQLRFYGPPVPANAGERVLVGVGEKAHIWRYDGQYGAVTQVCLVICSRSGPEQTVQPHTRGRTPWRRASRTWAMTASSSAKRSGVRRTSVSWGAFSRRRIRRPRGWPGSVVR